MESVDKKFAIVKALGQQFKKIENVVYVQKH